MPLYDSIMHACSSAGTGGFSIYGDSIAHYNSVYIEMVIAVFIILFGVNFNLYYYMLIRKFSLAYRERGAENISRNYRNGNTSHRTERHEAL